MNDLVSVIVPIYNVKDYLDACVESIVKQTYKNLEIWLVDDGSTDGCTLLCDTWADRDSRIHLIHQNNQGVSAARNAALDVCGGEWITFVDSDDIIAEDYVETLLFLAEKYNVSISQCNNRLVYAEKKVKTVEEQGVMKSTDFLLSDKFKMMAWGKLYQREIFEKVRYPYVKIHEDVAVEYKVVYEAKRVAYTEKELYFCNVRPDSLNAKNRYYPERLAILEIIREQIMYFESKNEPELTNKAYRDYAYELLTHYNKVRLLLKDKKIATQIKQEYRNFFPKTKKVKGISEKTKILLRICYWFPTVWNCVIKIEPEEYSIF